MQFSDSAHVILLTAYSIYLKIIILFQNCGQNIEVHGDKLQNYRHNILVKSLLNRQPNTKATFEVSMHFFF